MRREHTVIIYVCSDERAGGRRRRVRECVSGETRERRVLKCKSARDGDKTRCHGISALDVTENTCTPQGYFCVCKHPRERRFSILSVRITLRKVNLKLHHWETETGEFMWLAIQLIQFLTKVTVHMVLGCVSFV